MNESGMFSLAAEAFREMEERRPYLRYLRLQRAFEEYFNSECKLAAAAKLRRWRAGELAGEPQLCVLLGNPIKYSLSPLIHGLTADFCGKDDLYLNACLEAEAAEAFLREWSEDGASPLRGVNVTRPYKETVCKYLSENGLLTEAARDIGAVNTVFWQKGRLCGDNTDYSGWYGGWRTETGRELKAERAALFGAGGAARAVVYALIVKGVSEIYVVNSVARGRRLIEHFRQTAERLHKSVRFTLIENGREAGRELVKSDIFIQATPVGQLPAAEATVFQWPEPEGFSYRGKTACDLVYNPKETRFLREAAALGMETMSGASMLICQAWEARRRFFGSAERGEAPEPNLQLYERLLRLFV